MRKDRGRHEQKNCKGLSDSRQQVLKILRKPLFHATLADRTSAERACQIETGLGKANEHSLELNFRRTATAFANF